MTIALSPAVDELSPATIELRDEDRAHLVAGHGAEAAEWNVVEYLTEAARGSATAWIDGHRRYSFAHVRGAATVIADDLRARGLEPGAPVALYARNGLFWLAAYLGILSAGMIAVPLSASHPPVEAWRRAQWCGCRGAAIGHGQRWPTDLAAVPTVSEATLGEGWDAAPAETLPAAPVRAGADAVYLVTAHPADALRVVRITHDNIRAGTQSMLDCLFLEGSDRSLMAVPLSTSIGGSQLHTHLRIGAALVHHASAAVPESVVDALERFNCTGFAGDTTAFRALVANSSFTWRRLPQLRLLQQTGGTLPVTIEDELARSHPSARLFTLYARPEAVAGLACLTPEIRRTHRGSVGRGLPGVRLRVVDAGGADVQPGQPGQVQATGGNISPGYLNDEITTARTMRGRVLHTADAATVDDDGYIRLIEPDGAWPIRP